jgi:osmoprotectant transport system ATP-binding protein
MGAMIRLEELTKRYPGQADVAVDNVTMEIPEGEIVVLVGPSGCGKTTTLKMINRLIEPSSGRIFLEDEDVTDVDPDRLRRRIGYVIQQIGLFPHQTIADNIATVPGLLGWDKRRIAERVDELLDMVGLDPGTFRDRYPKELSGGQRQRAGVARAMGADPPVMLMDEPFGAIDPITRERLQNEFLRLQEEIRKTIVFVTHDIDEAVKMGDRIAIFNDDHRIAQFDAPESLLTEPADDFVRDFIGTGAAVKRLHLTHVGDIDLGDWPTAAAGTDRGTVRRLLAESPRNWLLVLDDQRRPVRWVVEEALTSDTEAATALAWPAPTSVGGPHGEPVTTSVSRDSTLYEALDQMLTSRVFCAPVVDDQGAYCGVVDVDALAEAIHHMRSGDGAG